MERGNLQPRPLEFPVCCCQIISPYIKCVNIRVNFFSNIIIFSTLPFHINTSFHTSTFMVLHVSYLFNSIFMKRTIRREK